MGWCFYSHLLYFGVQTGTKTNLFLVVYVYEVVLLVASCTSVYKQAPKQTYLARLEFFFYVYGVAFSRSLKFGVQTGTI